MTLLAWEMSTTVLWFEHSLVLSFLGIGMRIDLFQSCGHCWVIQIYWHIECNTLIASFFMVLNSSIGIPAELTFIQRSRNIFWIKNHIKESLISLRFLYWPCKGICLWKVLEVKCLSLRLLILFYLGSHLAEKQLGKGPHSSVFHFPPVGFAKS